ncbi:MAG: DUF6259 domain-containing protein [Planctomycetota bacterium]
MRRWFIPTIALCMILSCAPSLPRRGETKVTHEQTTVVVENDFFRIVVAAANGNITEFFDKASRRNLISPSLEKNVLYRISAVDEKGEAKQFDNTQATDCSVTFDDHRLTIASYEHAGQPISVIATCDVSDDSPLTRWRLRIENKTNLTIRRIAFPCVLMPPETDYILSPYCDGCLVERPGLDLPKGYAMGPEYPGSASCQVTAGGIGGTGLYLAAHDARGYKKSFGMFNTGAGVELAAAHYPRAGVGNDYKQPYDIVVGPYQGTWHAAADIYKAWAVKQHWCSKLLADRSDIPDWLKRAPMFITINFLKPQKDQPPASIYDNVRPSVKSYSDYLNRPMCALLGDWHGRGYYIAPHYFPPCGGDEKFTAFTRGLVEDGNRSIVFLCGIFWTVEKRPPVIHEPYDDWERFKREGEPHAIIGPDGKVAFTGVPDKKIGQNATLCPATRYTQRLMRDICKQCQKRGITMAQIETVGGGVPMCYSSKHNHKPGGGNYHTTAIYDLYKSVLHRGQFRDKEFALSIEEPAEYYIPVLTAYHSRDDSERHWPRSGLGIRGVPLFTYLYHEYSLGYGGHGPNVSSKKRNRAGEYMSAADFVCGKIPALSYWSAHVDAKDVDPDQMKIIQNIAAILDGPAREYLLFGKMLHPIPLDAPETKIGFWNEAAKKADQLAFPAVLHSVWQYPPLAREPMFGKKDETVGHGYAFVNIAEEEVEFTAAMPPPLPGKMYSVQEYGPWLGPRPVARNAAKPMTMTLRLKPGEARFVELLARWRNPVMPGPEE